VEHEPEILIRAWSLSDAADVERLVAHGRATLMTRRGGADLLGDGICDDPHDHDVRYLALYHGVAVGLAWADLIGRRLTLGLVFVEEEFRRLGIGSHLFDALADEGRRREAETIEALALPGDAAWKNLLEGHGVRARALVMSRPLDAQR
jgi:GNAT superfamily N-acetyltransferase